jgi:uncharacterized protein (TIGR02453 family)
MTFTGFTQETLDFYRELEKNNRKSWFEQNKSVYRREALEPAQAFVLAAGERLQSIAPGILYDTRTNGAGSIFRIHRDTRFSAEKTPYKTFLGISFWTGGSRKTENPGFYFQLEPDRLLLYCGLYLFPPDRLQAFREAVLDEKKGAAFVQAVREVARHQDVHLGGEHYKRVPRGVDPAHPRAEWLRNNTLYTESDCGLPDALFSAELVDYCVEIWRKSLPIHHWLSALYAAG